MSDSNGTTKATRKATRARKAKVRVNFTDEAGELVEVSAGRVVRIHEVEKYPHMRGALISGGLRVDFIATVGKDYGPDLYEYERAARERDLPELKEGVWLSSDYGPFMLYTRSRYDKERPPTDSLHLPITVCHYDHGIDPTTLEICVLPACVPKSKAAADLTVAGWIEIRHDGLSVYFKSAISYHSKRRR